MRARVYFDPENVTYVGESWLFWMIGLPLSARDDIHKELVDAFTAESEERGFKFTYFTIITVGIKSEK
jgi:hypothetical protein